LEGVLVSDTIDLKWRMDVCKSLFVRRSDEGRKMVRREEEIIALYWSGVCEL
jgi:hypothetical protein